MKGALTFESLGPPKFVTFVGATGLEFSGKRTGNESVRNTFPGMIADKFDNSSYGVN